MVRAHSRACMVLVINGNSRRSSTAAANSPCCSKAVRIGGFHLGDDEHTARMATRTEDGKCRAHVNRRDTRKATASPPLTGGAAAVASGDRLCAAVRRGQCALGRLPLISGVNRQCRRQAGSSPRRRHLAAPLVKCDSPSKAHSWEVRSVIHVSAQHIFPSHP